MNSSMKWERLYQNKKQLSAWPWSDLVSYVMRYTDPKQLDFSVLELGCGSGANIPFFKKLGVKYYGIEGSPTVVKYLTETYPELKDNLLVGDFTREIPFAQSFDLVVDRGSLTHNSTKALQNALKILYPKIKCGGKIISIGFFSTESTDFKEGRPSEDAYSREGFTRGHLAGTGLVHFADKAHLQELFSHFEFKVLEHTSVQREIPVDQDILAFWNFVVMKK